MLRVKTWRERVQMTVVVMVSESCSARESLSSEGYLLAGFPAYTATDVTIPDAGTCLAHSGGRTEARVAGDRVSRGNGKR